MKILGPQTVELSEARVPGMQKGRYYSKDISEGQQMFSQYRLNSTIKKSEDKIPQV